MTQNPTGEEPTDLGQFGGGSVKFQRRVGFFINWTVSIYKKVDFSTKFSMMKKYKINL
jgi:hypothetical protein